MGRISTHACRDKKSCICSAMGTRPHLGKLECPTALSGDGDLLKSGQRVHSKWHGMKVVGRQARWQNPHSPPSPGNAVCSWLNGVGEVCTHFHPFGKFLSNGKTEKLLHGKTSHHLHEFTNCHASAFYSQHRVKKYMATLDQRTAFSKSS